MAKFIKATDPADGKTKFVLAKHGSTAKAFAVIPSPVTSNQLITSDGKAYLTSNNENFICK